MLNTPDLSTKYLPQPKPTPKAKKQPAPIKPGKKTVAWEDGRAQLKAIFKDNGIVECELKRAKICWRKNALTFAHIDKRRYLTDEEIKSAHSVCLLCTPCHQYVEQLPREEMKKILAACRREPMKWGSAVTISPTSSTIGAQEGSGGQLRTPGG